MRFRTPSRTLHHHARLAAPDPNAQCETVGVGPSGELVAAWRSGQAVILAAYAPHLTRKVRIAGLDTMVTALQPLPDGGFVLVIQPGHTVGRPRQGNGRVGRTIDTYAFDSDGSLTAQGDVGGYVEELHTTRTGATWVGYSDVGVYSGSGLSIHGLVKFSMDLEPEWTFPHDELQHSAVIDHCKSLNVVGETVWTCPYSEYPLIHVVGPSVDTWHWDDRGHVDNFAAVLVPDHDKPERVAAVAEGSSHHPGRIVIGALAAGEVTSTTSRSLRLPDGSAFPKHAHIVGRGPDLHVIDGLDWYRSDLEHLTG